MFDNIDGIFNTNDQALQRIALLESQFRNLPISNQAYFVQGRLRTDRAAPANSADVAAQDLIYDRVLTDAFEYILINNAGTLEWRRTILSAF
jgi:hypothetical protein